jgi:HEAT repeat protein
MRAWIAALTVILTAFGTDVHAGGFGKRTVSLAEVERLVQRLADTRPEARRAAVDGVASLARDLSLDHAAFTVESRRVFVEAAIPRLVDALDATDEHVRTIAAMSLGNLGSSSVVRRYLRETGKQGLAVDMAPFVRALQRDDDSVLAFLPHVRPWPAVVHAEVVRIARSDEHTAGRAAVLLAEGDPSDRQVVLDLLRTSADRSTPASALRQLPLGPEEVRQVLDVLASVPDPEEQVWILEALRGSGEQDVATLRPLVALLDAPDPKVRDRAAGLLGRLAPRARELLPKVLAVLRRDLGREAAETLAKMRPPADYMVPLIEIVRNDDAPVDTRIHVMEALAGMGRAARPAIPALYERAKRAQEVERGRAEDAAWRIGHAR